LDASLPPNTTESTGGIAAVIVARTEVPIKICPKRPGRKQKDLDPCELVTALMNAGTPMRILSINVHCMSDVGGRFSLSVDRFLGPGRSGISHENCQKSLKMEKTTNHKNLSKIGVGELPKTKT
jgi:hypothetical protein